MLKFANKPVEVIATQLPTIFTIKDVGPQINLLNFRNSARHLFSLKPFHISPSTFEYSLPKQGVPEVGFVGRSNVGKSSLVSCLLGDSKLVRISKEPGCTQNINFFTFSKDENIESHSAYLVDMPGYGFAKKSGSDIDRWNKIIGSYVSVRDQMTLKRIFVLVDSRCGMAENDLEMMKQLDTYEIPYQVIFTKKDLVSDSELRRNLRDAFIIIMRTKKFAQMCFPYIHVISAKTGEGIDSFKLQFAELCGNLS